MFVVTGSPRSGTSMMMQCLIAGLGEEKLVGKKFPQIERRKAIEQQRDIETDQQYAYRLYTLKLSADKDSQAEENRMLDMNPKGFWESPFTTPGISFSPGIAAELSGYLIEKKKKSFVKIVSNGLARSDPRFVDKVILMVRHPRQVAKSQERLVRKFNYRVAGKRSQNLYEGIKIHSPRMYIDNSFAVSGWLTNYSDVPVHIVDFDKLFTDPVAMLTGVFDFLGYGDSAAAVKCIDQKLRRSYPEPDENVLWADAEKIHAWLLAGNFVQIDKFRADTTRASFKSERRWVCVRSGLQVHDAICKRCKDDPLFATSARRGAEQRGIEWRVLPCAWDVAFNDRGKFMAIDDSIIGNHWVTEDDRRRVAFESERLRLAAAKKKRSGE